MSSSKPELFMKETEFFGFTPISLVDDVINSVNEYLYQAVDQLQVYFQGQKAIPTDEVQKGLDKVVTLLEASVDKNFDKFELYVLKNIFRIPPAIKLPHQQNLDFSHTAEEEQAVDEELDDLEKRIASARYTHHILNQEYLLLQKTVNVLEKCDAQLQFIADITAKHDLPALGDSVKPLVEKFGELKGLVWEVAKLSGILEANEAAQPSQKSGGSLASAENIQSVQTKLS